MDSSQTRNEKVILTVLDESISDKYNAEYLQQLSRIIDDLKEQSIASDERIHLFLSMIAIAMQLSNNKKELADEWLKIGTANNRYIKSLYIQSMVRNLIGNEEIT